MSNKEYSVNWRHHMSHVKKAFDHLLASNDFVDVTIWCEGKKLQAHKVLLSACSNFFYEILKDSPRDHPIVILAGVKYSVLSDILHFVYNGEVSVDNSNLEAFLKAARMLQISGLTDNTTDNNENSNDETDSTNKASSLQESDNIYKTEEVPKNTNKRPLPKEFASTSSETESSEKVLKTSDENNIYLPDIKCEPTEMVVFDDPLEDPLQSDQFRDNDYASGSCTQNFGEEEIKLEIENATLLTDVKVRHSNFSEDCLKCTICGKIFSHPYSLHHHKAVHSGNTQCPICHAVLSRKYNLKMHMKARHNV